MQMFEGEFWNDSEIHIDEAMDRISQLKHEKYNLAKQLSMLQDLISTTDERIAQLEEENRVLKADNFHRIRSLQQQNETLKSALSEKEEFHEQLAQKLEHLETTKKKLQQDKELFSERVKFLEEEASQKQQMFLEESRKRLKNETMVFRLAKERLAVLAELNEMKSKIREMQNVMEQLNSNGAPKEDKEVESSDFCKQQETLEEGKLSPGTSLYNELNSSLGFQCGSTIPICGKRANCRTEEVSSGNEESQDPRRDVNTATLDASTETHVTNYELLQAFIHITAISETPNIHTEYSGHCYKKGCKNTFLRHLYHQFMDHFLMLSIKSVSYLRYFMTTTGNQIRSWLEVMKLAGDNSPNVSKKCADTRFNKDEINTKNRKRNASGISP